MNDDSTPDTGGSDGGTDDEYAHLESNDHARGNDGGAPAGNQNAVRHGLYSDPDNLLQHLQSTDPDAMAWIDRKFEGYLSEAPFGPLSPKADQLLQVCVREYSIWQATGLQVRDGVVKKQAVETGDGEWIQAEKENAANLALDRMEKTVTKRLKELGILGDAPAARLAGAMEIRSEDYAIQYDEDEDPTDDPSEMEWTIERPLEDDGDE